MLASVFVRTVFFIFLSIKLKWTKLKNEKIIAFVRFNTKTARIKFNRASVTEGRRQLREYFYNRPRSRLLLLGSQRLCDVTAAYGTWDLGWQQRGRPAWEYFCQLVADLTCCSRSRVWTKPSFFFFAGNFDCVGNLGIVFFPIEPGVTCY